MLVVQQLIIMRLDVNRLFGESGIVWVYALGNILYLVIYDHLLLIINFFSSPRTVYYERKAYYDVAHGYKDLAYSLLLHNFF